MDKPQKKTKETKPKLKLSFSNRLSWVSWCITRPYPWYLVLLLFPFLFYGVGQIKELFIISHELRMVNGQNFIGLTSVAFFVYIIFFTVLSLHLKAHRKNANDDEKERTLGNKNWDDPLLLKIFQRACFLGFGKDAIFKEERDLAATRFLAAFPFLLFAILDLFFNGHFGYFLLNLLALILIPLIVFLWGNFTMADFSKLQYEIEHGDSFLAILAKVIIYPFKPIMEAQAVGFGIQLVLFGLLLLGTPLAILFFPKYFSAQLVGWFLPIQVFLYGFTFFLGIVLYLLYLGRKSATWPVYVIVILILLGCGYFNNNHKIRTISTENYERTNVEDRFVNWVNHRLQNGLYSKDSTNYLFLIASEGGGIRATAWTTEMLERLSEIDPTFMQKTFALSGVSGGSVGVSLHTSAYANSLTKGQDIKLDTLYTKDLLTPLLIGFFLPDFVQRFLPIPILAWDRARFLEDRLAKAYEETTNFNTLDQGFLSLWDTVDSLNIPNLFINTTRVEDGKKCLISNIRPDPNYFIEAVDLMDTIKEDLPLKVAAMISARFPIVTPAARVNANKQVWGNLVDGGYFDNSGLHTAFQLVNAINDIKKSKFDSIALKPVIIFLKNSKDEVGKPLRIFQESQSPINAFLNSWTARANALIPELLDLRDEFDFELLTFKMNRTKEDHDIPLGWSLSKETMTNIRRLVDEASSKSTAGDRIDQENYDNFSSFLKFSITHPANSPQD